MNPFFMSDDGYTDRAFLSGIIKVRNENGSESPKRIHPPMRVYFRPTTNLQRSAISDLINALPARGKEEGADNIMVREVGKRLVSWQFFDNDGNPVSAFPNNDGTETQVPEPSEVALRQLRNDRLWARLCSIVYIGVDNGDDDPDFPAKVDTPKERLKAKLGN